MLDTHTTDTAVVVLIDAHSAVIDRCDGTELTRIRALRAGHPHGKSDHMGDTPRQSFHSGTRGETASDAMQRAQATARHHFVHRVAPIIAAAAHPDEPIVLGGTPAFATELQHALAKVFGRESIVAEDINHALPASTLAARVNAAVQLRRDTWSMDQAQAVLERTGAHTTGVVGSVATLDAAEHGAAATVLMTPQFLGATPDEAARITEATRLHGGRVETVEGAAGELLDARAGGVGALLRFALHAMPKSG